MGKRMNIHGKGVGLADDITSTGAKCLAGQTTFTNHDRAVLRVGDMTTPCPRCGVPGVIQQGDLTTEHLGMLVAVDGCTVACGCPPGSHYLIAPLDGGSGAAASGVMGLGAALAVPLAGSGPERPGNEQGETLAEEEEEEEELTGIVLRLGLFFDGTGNNQSNSEAAAECRAINVGLSQEAAEDIRQHCAAYGFDGSGATPDNSYGNDVSNVARLYDLYPDQADEHLPPESDMAHLKVYLEGVGTSAGQQDSPFSQGTGRGSTGVLARVKQMPALVTSQIERLRKANPDLKIRRIEIDLFGFSRGAAAARHCANDLLKGADSLLAKALPAGSPVLDDGFAWRHRTDFSLGFIGLFDTVAAVVAPWRGDFSPHDGRNADLELGLAPGCARQVVQLVAANEYRHNFSLTRTDHDIRLPGAHSDIGGGYLPLATEKVFLSPPESNQVSLGTANEWTQAYLRTRQTLERRLPAWQPYVQRIGIETWEVRLPFNKKHDHYPEKRVYAAVRSERQVRGELSRVYLRIMRELAVRAGVAFNVIQDRDPALALPDELQPIATKLLAYALGESFPGLSEEEVALLQHRYIHLSAHWNAAKGKHESELEVMFINRPAKGGKRAEYPNE